MKKLNEKALNKIIDDLIHNGKITTDEKKILYQYKYNMDKSFMNRIYYLKKNLSNLIISNGFDNRLSDDILSLYTEICREYPTTGPSSIFNGLIR